MNEKLLANILAIMLNSSLSESFAEAVLNRLVSFGYELKEDDGLVICFAIQKIENHIKTTCNTDTIPDGLFHVAVDMVCGEFFLGKSRSGTLELSNLDLNGAITAISEGDTSVQFATDVTDEKKFNALLEHLLFGREGDLVCYRKLRW